MCVCVYVHMFDLLKCDSFCSFAGHVLTNYARKFVVNGFDDMTSVVLINDDCLVQLGIDMVILTPPLNINICSCLTMCSFQTYFDFLPSFLDVSCETVLTCLATLDWSSIKDHEWRCETSKSPLTSCEVR